MVDFQGGAVTGVLLRRGRHELPGIIVRREQCFNCFLKLLVDLARGFQESGSLLGRRFPIASPPELP